jgi:hypothetical protein
MVNRCYQELEIFANHVLAMPGFLQSPLSVVLTWIVNRSMWLFGKEPELMVSQLGDRRIREMACFII